MELDQLLRLVECLILFRVVHCSFVAYLFSFYHLFVCDIEVHLELLSIPQGLVIFVVQLCSLKKAMNFLFDVYESRIQSLICHQNLFLVLT